MKFMNLFKSCSILIALMFVCNMLLLGQPYTKVYVDVTNGSDTYTGEYESNSPAGKGPKATIDGGLSVLANNGTLVILAGNYNGADNAGGSLNINSANYTTLTTGLKIQFKPMLSNYNINLTAGSFTFNIADGTLNMESVSGAVFNQTSQSVTLTNGNINLDNSSTWSIADNTIININGNSSFKNAAPNNSKAPNISLNYYGGGSITAGPEANYSNYGTGIIYVNKSGGGTVTFLNAIQFSNNNSGNVINITSGNVIFNNPVWLGIGNIRNSGSGTVTFYGSINLGIAEGSPSSERLSQILNTSKGSIIVNATSIWNVTEPLIGGPHNYENANIPAVNNSGTGIVQLGNVILLTENTSDGSNYKLYASNAAGAKMIIGNVSSPSSGLRNNYGDLSLVNEGANTGSCTLLGGTFRGNLINSGTITVNGALTVNGVLTNSGTIDLATNILTLAGNAAHLTNGGIVTTSSGGINITANGLVSFNGGSLGNATVSGIGNTLNINSNPIVFDNLTITAGTVNIDVNITVNGTAQLKDGSILLGYCTLTTKNYEQFNGDFTLTNDARSILIIKGNLNRTAGSFTAASSNGISNSEVKFSGTTAQQINGGSLFQVGKLTFDNSVNTITIGNSMRANNTVTIFPSTRINMGSLNLILNGGTNGIINHGYYSAIGGGGVIIGGVSLVVNGAAGYAVTPTYKLEGTGTYSNITIDVGANKYAKISAAGGITWSGVLRLFSGTLDVINTGVDLSPAGTNASIVRHIYKTGSQPALMVSGGGTFNSANIAYDLEYATGNVLENTDVDILNGSIEFPNSEVLIRNLTINAKATGTGSVQLSVSRTIFGNLIVGTDSRLSFKGCSLTALGIETAHVISGEITRATHSTNEKLILNGSGTLHGSNGFSSIQSLDINTSGSYSIINMKNIGENAITGGLTILGGAKVTLTMANLGTSNASDPGDVFNMNISYGKVTLYSDMEVPGKGFTVSANGTFDFGNSNIWWTSNGTFACDAAATLLSTNASNGGYLQFKATAAINTNGVLVPRLIIDPDNKGTFTVTMTGSSGVSDILTNTGDDILDLATFTFIHAGYVWNHGGTAKYVSSSGNGVFKVTGNLTAYLAADATLSNLTVANSENTFTLADNDKIENTAPKLIISDPVAKPGVFSLTNGTINLQTVDIELADDGTVPGPIVFDYSSGIINAITEIGINSTDNKNGEIVFNGHSLSPRGYQRFSFGTTMLTIPNLRIQGSVNGVALSAANPFTVSKRLVLGSGGNLVFGTDGRLILSDGALIERRGNAILSNSPTLAGKINVCYSGPNSITPGIELPSASLTPQLLYDLYINTDPGVDVNANKNILVTGSLNLVSGNYDFENVANTIYTIKMANGSTVRMQNGALINGASETVTTLIGGPVNLEYTYTGESLPLKTKAREFPEIAGFVAKLSVLTNSTANPALQLHANRTVGGFILNNGSENETTERFDLNGYTLTVDNTTPTSLEKGIISNETFSGSLYNYGSLDVKGSLSSTSNSSIQNINVTAAKLILAGSFGATDWDGIGVISLPSNLPTATVSDEAVVADFAGNLTGAGDFTFNGLYSEGTVTSIGNITINLGGELAIGTSLIFAGSVNTMITIPSTGASVGQITLSKTSGINCSVTLAGGNLTATGFVKFINGLFVTSNKIINIPAPLFGAGQGFTRVGVTGTNISHVVGNVAKTLFNGGGTPLTACEPRQEFPVGSMTAYKLVAITFNPAFGLATTPNATLTVATFDGNPGGAVGLPIKDGVAAGIDVARYPNFYWTIAADPNNIGPSSWYDLELTATGFTDYDDINNVRIIRRHGLPADIGNQWLFQGVDANDKPNPSLYDNELNAGIPSIIQKNANAGLRQGGAVFTLGMKSSMSLVEPIVKQWLGLSGLGAGAKNAIRVNGTAYDFNTLFTGQQGALSPFKAQSSNPEFVTVPANFTSTLLLTPVAIGTAWITVIASDAANNDFFATSFEVTVGLTDVVTEELPTEFALYQNFPNPFNPTTNIKFALPKESNVTLKIYNILGQEVATLVNKVMPAGYHTVNFSAAYLSTGMYIYRIEAQDFVSVKKMLLMK